MELGQLSRCLVGRHLRDKRRVVVEGRQITSRCLGCHASMRRSADGWHATGRGRFLPVFTASAAVLAAAALMIVFTHVSFEPEHDLVVFVGDSITEGVASSDPLTTSRPGLYQAHAGNDVIVANEGVNGITLGSLVARIAVVEHYYRSGRKNIVVFDAGSNDFAQGGQARPLFAMLLDYTARLRASGWIVAVGTVMARAGLTDQQERERRAFNRLLIQGPLRAQGVTILDFDAEQRRGHIEIADGVHPSDKGYVGMSRLETVFLDRALSGGAPAR